MSVGAEGESEGLVDNAGEGSGGDGDGIVGRGGIEGETEEDEFVFRKKENDRNGLKNEGTGVELLLAGRCLCLDDNDKERSGI